MGQPLDICWVSGTCEHVQRTGTGTEALQCDLS